MRDRKTGDKKAVVGEAITDEQLQRFLRFSSYDDQVPDDLHILIKAYRGLRAPDFERFLRYFLEDGRDINAADGRGRTIASIVRGHARSQEYLEALEEAGAR